MTTSKSTLRNLAGASAIALAFGPLATPANALDANIPGAMSRATYTFFSEISRVASNTGDRAGGFMAQLETALKAPADKTRVVVYPSESSVNMLVIGAVVPPKGLESQPIPVCAQMNNQVIYTGKIMNDGQVLPVTWNGPSKGELLPDGRTKPACSAYIVYNKSAIYQLAQERANGAPTASTQQGPANPSSPAN